MEHVFVLANLVALSGWAAMGLALVFKAARRAAAIYAGLLVPVLFALAYVALLATAQNLKGGFGSIAEVRSLFQNDQALTAGWIHYLAFDLFVGAWVLKDGQMRGVHPLLLAPCLVLTFLFGPAGFLLFQILRLLSRPRPTP